ncbi:hydroxyacid dehydrogenase [Fulvimarina sp. MAC3]|uniref:hydroxyacid dehydrogenase n=1 Tax=Fulvimarina sp. MAC3 TaxID=3148887 RepID=UPI0031FBF1C7
MSDIVISEFMDEAAVNQLRERHDVLYDPDLVNRPDALKDALKTAKALIVRNRTQVSEDILSDVPALTCVGRLGVGLDNIDLDACKAKAIAVYPATGANDVAVAEYVVTAALTLLRKAYHRSADVAAGTWPRMEMMGGEIAGKRLGLIGFGGIARKVAARARVFGCEIAAFDPFLPETDVAWESAQRLELQALLETSDIVSLHVPLSETTRHLIGRDALKAMKPGAILINTARGGVVDEAALVEALRSDQLGGAALDVFETEPLNAEAGALFQGVPNLILTPHIAGVTKEANVRVSAVTADNVLNHLKSQSA